MKSRGFTLIELLAIIIILAIIAVITTPILFDTIEKSRKETAKNSAFGITETAKQYYFKYEEENESDFNCEFPENCTLLNYDGLTPTTGTIKINDIGIVFGEVTYYDKYTFCIYDNEVITGTCSETISKQLAEQIKEKGSTHIYKSDGSLDIYKIQNCIQYDVEVKSDGTTLPFCVIGETSDEVTLIAKDNTVIGAQWLMGETSYNGMFNKLLEETQTWDKIPVISSYTYDDSQHGYYKLLNITNGKLTITKSNDTTIVIGSDEETAENRFRARIMTVEEAYQVINGTTNISNNSTCNNAPDWLEPAWTITYYKTGTSGLGQPYEQAYQTKNTGGNCGISIYAITETKPVKAVITLDKSQL